MLTIDPTKRITAKEALEHKFICGDISIISLPKRSSDNSQTEEESSLISNEEEKIQLRYFQFYYKQQRKIQQLKNETSRDE
jgi:hypothetical protein